jgi:hypothetical protein
MDIAKLAGLYRDSLKVENKAARELISNSVARLAAASSVVETNASSDPEKGGNQGLIDRARREIVTSAQAIAKAIKTPTNKKIVDAAVADVAAAEAIALAAAEPMAAEPLAAEPLAAEPLAAEPLAAEPLAAEPLAAEPLAAEPLAAEAFVGEPVAFGAAQPGVDPTSAAFSAALHAFVNASQRPGK